jgi:hypothetical protein
MEKAQTYLLQITLDVSRINLFITEEIIEQVPIEGSSEMEVWVKQRRFSPRLSAVFL